MAAGWTPVKESAPGWTPVLDQNDQIKAELESRPPMSMFDKAAEVGKMLISPITSIPSAIRQVAGFAQDPGSVAAQNLNPQTAATLPGAASVNPAQEAYGNAVAAAGATRGTPSIHQAVIDRLKAAGGEVAPAEAAVPASGGGMVSNVRTLWKLYQTAKKFSPTKVAEQGFEHFLDYVAGKTQAPAAAAPPVAPVEALTPTRAPAVPPQAAAIVRTAQAAPPLTTAEQSLADHIMANVEPEAAAPPAAGPASIPLQGPADMPAPRAGQVGPAAMPATPAAALQMPGPQGAPVPASPAEAVSQAPQVQVIPSPEPAVPQSAYKAKAQAAKTTKVAQYLHDNGITASQIEQMLRESDPAAVTAFMDDVAKRAGQKVLSPDESVPMMVEKLKSLEKPSAAAEVPEALRKNPAAMKAAMDVRDALAKK